MKISRRLIGIIGALLVFASMVLQVKAGQTNVNVVAWGDNTFGQVNVPSDLTNAVAIATGKGFSLALREDGTVAAWGNNCCGQTNIPVGLSNVTAICAGGSHSLALQNSGLVVAWGDNTFGQTAVPLGLNNVVAISAHCGHHNLALRADGTVVSWGLNVYSETDVPGDLSGVKAIAAGSYLSFAVRSNGNVVAWGDNRSGALTLPQDVTNVVAISAGYDDDVNLALRGDGTIVEWGTVVDPTHVPTNLNIIAVAVPGGENWDQDLLALRPDGTAVHWKVNNGTTATYTFPATAVAISVGSSHSLALLRCAPLVTITPKTQTVGIGSSGFIGAQGSGSGPFTYQWYFGTNAMTGETNQTLSLTSISTSQSGEYHVVVANLCGSTVSETVIVNVVPALSINMIPAVSIFGEVGTNYTLQYINAIGPTNTWNDLVTLMLTNSPQFYPDYSAIGQPQRFYRAVQTP